MPNGPDHKPFAPDGTISREELLAYVHGQLTPARQHAVEKELERDPLLREALEGLSMPQATAGLAALDGARPRGGGHGWLRPLLALPLVLLLMAGWLVLSPLLEQGAPDGGAATTTSTDVPADPFAGTEPTPPLEDAEIMAAEEQPGPMLIGHGADERHTLAMRPAAPVEREQPVERLSPTEPAVVNGTGDAARPARPRKASRQLVYLHDLKLLHPSEMYANEVRINEDPRHIPARHADRPAMEREGYARITMAYLPFLDEALSKFVAHDHKGALADLRFLLEQYPDDVNALFYAGLCSYNLGLYERARSYLARAATHPMDIFDEEAEWYHALTLERLGDEEAAQRAFAGIAFRGGFYAAKAAERAP
jgi:hypothetical protein